MILISKIMVPLLFSGFLLYLVKFTQVLGTYRISTNIVTAETIFFLNFALCTVTFGDST